MKLVGNKEEGYQLVSSFAAPAKPTKNAGKDKNKDADKGKGAGKDKGKGNTQEPQAPDGKNGAATPDNENGNAVAPEKDGSAVAPDTEKEKENGKDNE